MVDALVSRALQAVGHLGLFVATGILTAWFFTQAMWLPFALALWCHGTFGTFMYIAGHDLGHGTVFRTKWLNRFFQSIYGVLSFWNPHEHDLSHIYHHRYTLYPEGGDPADLFVGQPSQNARAWLLCRPDR